MLVEEIKIPVVQVTDIAQFKTEKGVRKLYMHFFLKMEDGNSWQYRWVDHTTDPACLKDWIAAGRIFIFLEGGPVKEINP